MFFVLVAAFLVALAQCVHHYYFGHGTDLKLVNLGEVPDLAKIVTSFEGLGDHLASLDDDGKEKISERLRSLSFGCHRICCYGRVTTVVSLEHQPKISEILFVYINIL